MKRRWHWSLWVGLGLTLAGGFTFPFFAKFPMTRSYGWLNLVLLVSGVVLLFTGTRHAFREPNLHQGRIMGPILSVLALAVTGLFAFGILYLARIPTATTTLTVGQAMPALALTDQDGKTLTQADLLAGASPAGTPAKGALLIFYRGYW